MSTITLKLETPNVPHFVRLANQQPSLRQEGFKEAMTISIADLNEEQLTELADKWKVKLLEQAEVTRVLIDRVRAFSWYWHKDWYEVVEDFTKEDLIDIELMDEMLAYFISAQND